MKFTKRPVFLNSELVATGFALGITYWPKDCNISSDYYTIGEEKSVAI